MIVEIKVRLKKIHKSWETFYPDLKVGTELLLQHDNEGKNHLVITPSGVKLDPNEMCKAFSNSCAYSDIFEKVNDEICLKD